jgi:glycosyltransferase involved in cell wall biosynthesis
LVEKAIASVLGQTYSGCEVIVVDDGSTDDTERRLANRSDIRYVRVENGGQGWARNHGIRASRGRWIAFLDSDDVWYPHKLAKQMRIADDPAFRGVGVICTDYDTIDMDGNVLTHKGTCTGFPLFTDCEFHLKDVFGRCLQIDDLTVMCSLRLPVLAHGNCFLPSTALIRRQLIEQCGGFKGILVEDVEAFLRWATKMDFAFIDEPLVGYSVGREGKHTSFRNLEALVVADLAMRRQFFAHNPGIVSNREQIDRIFSEIIARRAPFQVLRGDLEGARNSLQKAKTYAALKGKYAKLDVVLKLPDRMALQLLRLRRVLKYRLGEHSS